ILDITAIDAEGGQSLLGMSCQDCCQIHGSRTFGPVETPYCLGVMWVHVHRFRPVAPAGGYCNGSTHTFPLELCGTCGTLTHTPYRGVGNHALDRGTVAIFQV